MPWEFAVILFQGVLRDVSFATGFKAGLDNSQSLPCSSFTIGLAKFT